MPHGGACVTIPVVVAHLRSGARDCNSRDACILQDAADLHVARAHVEALRVAFEFGTKMLNNHVMKHSDIVKSRGNRNRLAELVKTDLVKFTLDVRFVSDIFGNIWAYLPAMSVFPYTPGSPWSRLAAYIQNVGLINADVLQLDVAVGPAPI